MIADCHMMLRMELVMLQAMDTALGLGGVQFFSEDNHELLCAIGVDNNPFG